ncbi:hypothetical protein F4777DRAFT_81336 [Nemania sp. FL0916]|nr:hypothetical protein F4777DRAFT_81336 [Nemania sp. FL0916]
MSEQSGTLAGALRHNRHGKTQLIVQTIFLALDFISMGIRLWSRRLQKTRLQANDFIILAAQIVVIAEYAMTVVLIVDCGLGLHTDEVERIGGPERLVAFRKVLYVMNLMWLTPVSLIKISILHFYTVVFRKKRFQQLVYALIGVNIVFLITATFSNVFFCTPPAKQWLLTVPGHCNDATAIYVVLSSIDLGMDIIVILLPMPILWRLHLATAKKISLTIVFGLGILIIIITAIRITFVSDVATPDQTYTFTRIALFSALTPQMGIINANLPLSAPVLRKFFSTPILSTTVENSNRTMSSNIELKRLREGEHYPAAAESTRSLENDPYLGGSLPLSPLSISHVLR